MSEEKSTRAVDIEIEIDAPLEQVWAGLTEAEQMMRWLAPKVEVTPGAGGTMFVSWGPGAEGTARIEIWEPLKHLRYTMPPSESTIAKLKAEGREGTFGMPVDYFLEGRGGKTLLRLVHSGFGTSGAWDDEYDGTSVGWAMFMRMLRHTVAEKFGTANIGLVEYLFTPSPLDETYQRLITGLGLRPDLREGDSYSIESPSGERISGRVQMLNPQTGFAGTWEQQSNALIGATLLRQAGGTVVNWGALMYGVTQQEADAAKQRWVEWLKQIFPTTQTAQSCN